MFEQMTIQPSDAGIFKEVDDVIGRSLMVGDPKLAFDYGRDIVRLGTLKGLALAKLLYRLDEYWELFRTAGTGDDLFTMSETQMNVKPQTARKYIRMWGAVFENEEISDETKTMLKGKPVEDLIRITAAAREGSLDDDDLKTIAVMGPDEIRETIREKRGEKTSSRNAIRIYLQVSESELTPPGTLFYRQGANREVIGYKVPELSETGEKAWASIINARGIQEV